MLASSPIKSAIRVGDMRSIIHSSAGGDIWYRNGLPVAMRRVSEGHKECRLPFSPLPELPHNAG